MQNRFVLSGVPLGVKSHPQAREELKAFVEEQTCWIDRFAWVDDSEDDNDLEQKVGNNDECDATATTAAAIELNLENMRDQAVADLDGREITLLQQQQPHNSRNRCCFRFVARAAPATRAQSDLLLKYCPDNGKEQSIYQNIHDYNHEGGTMMQTIYFDGNATNSPNNDKVDETEKEEFLIGLEIQKTIEGGTGSETWKGGVLLAQQICQWFCESKEKRLNKGNKRKEDDSDSSLIANTATAAARLVDILFTNKDVLELGAGSAGLPSLVLAAAVSKCRRQQQKKQKQQLASKATITHLPRSIVASDAIDEVLETLRKNVTFNKRKININDGNACVDVCVHKIDWNNYNPLATRPSSTTTTKRTNSPTSSPPSMCSADSILFADCIYTQQGGMALQRAIEALLRPDGNVVGVLPDFRVGVSSFENQMVKRGFHPNDITPITPLQSSSSSSSCSSSSFHCAGGSSKNYRIIWWSSDSQ